MGGLGPGLLATTADPAELLPEGVRSGLASVRAALFAMAGVTISVMLEAMHLGPSASPGRVREAEAASQAKDRFLAVLSHDSDRSIRS